MYKDFTFAKVLLDFETTQSKLKILVLKIFLASQTIRSCCNFYIPRQHRY